VAMTLNGDQPVGCTGRGFGNVAVQLIESFTADAASTAVLEQEDRALAGFVDGLVESGDVGDWVQLFHAVPSLYRVVPVYPAGPLPAAHTGD
jgi:hypothetical protein